MPETLADPSIHTCRTFGEPVSWTADIALPGDEVNPDTLIAVNGILIGALEGQVEANHAAANWETLQFRTAKDAETLVISASVRAL